MRYIKHHLESIVGIEIFPIISLLIFFTFFVLLGIYLVTQKKDRMKMLKQIPLENEEDSDNQKDLNFKK